MRYRLSNVYIQVKVGCFWMKIRLAWGLCRYTVQFEPQGGKTGHTGSICVLVGQLLLSQPISVCRRNLACLYFFQNSMFIFFFHQDPEKLHMLVCICCRMCLRSWQLSYASTSGHPLYLCKFISFGAEIKAGESSGSAQDESYQVPLKLSFLLSYVSLSLFFSIWLKGRVKHRG